MNKLFNILKGGLIVSCQAYSNSPFNSPEGVTLFAKAAEMSGAAGIRSEGFAKTKMIKESVSIPVVGLIKSEFEDGYVKITGSFDEVEQLLSIGTNMIAIDGTFRLREGLSGPEFIREVKRRYDCCILADIATYEEGMACVHLGVDAVSTTLSGYTPETAHMKELGADFELVKKLSSDTGTPIFAEGRINSPSDAALMLKSGAFGVIVGSAITNPNYITNWYISAMNKVSEGKI